MFSRHVPLWIPIGGALLACSAGAVNAVGFLSISHAGLSHMSGNVTLLGIHVAEGDWVVARATLALVLCFFAGSVLSALIIRRSTLKLGRRYSVALSVEAGLLFLAARVMVRDQWIGDYLAAAACGLQNALATSYSGAVIRTTHVTGMLTDCGIALGLWLRREPVEWPRLRLYGFLFGGFLLGGFLGFMGYRSFGFATLYFPAGLSLAGALAHLWIWKFLPHWLE
jgi:uncharacterized membrane protein YoaK (UPF0700 family)